MYKPVGGTEAVVSCLILDPDIGKSAVEAGSRHITSGGLGSTVR